MLVAKFINFIEIKSPQIYTFIYFFNIHVILHIIYIFRQTKIDKSNQGEILCYTISINKRNIRERDKI